MALRLALPPLGEHGPARAESRAGLLLRRSMEGKLASFCLSLAIFQSICNPPGGLSRYVNPRFLPGRTRY